MRGARALQSDQSYQCAAAIRFSGRHCEAHVLFNRISRINAPRQSGQLEYLYQNIRTMLVQKGGCVYIITNRRHTVLYTGVTSDLNDRIKKHKEKFYPKSFTASYNCDKLVWFETYLQIEEAIDREKQIKAGSRAKKIQLIDILNPEWKDLWETDVRFW